MFQAYISETNVNYQKEYCAVAVLYMWGGYYFDTDMEMTSKPPKIIDTSLVSAIYNETISTSFIASTAQHPVLIYYIRMLHT